MYLECSNNLKKRKKNSKIKKIEQLDFRYFNIWISKYRLFYIWSFEMLTPTHLF